MRRLKRCEPVPQSSLTDDHHDPAAGVAEGDGVDRALDARVDPPRAGPHELRDVAEHVVVGLARGRARRRVDRHDAGAGVAAAVVRAAVRVERGVPGDHRLGPVAHRADGQEARVPVQRVAEGRRRVRRLRAGALGEVDVLVRVQRRGGPTARSGRPSSSGTRCRPASGWRRGRRAGPSRSPGWRPGRPDVVGVQRPVVVVAEQLGVEPRASERRADRLDQPRLLRVAEVHARILEREAVLRLVLQRQRVDRDAGAPVRLRRT